MTGLAADTGFGPACFIARIFRVEVFAKVCTVALDTATVRILKMSGPEERMLGVDIFIGSQVKPALPAFCRTSAVPGYIQSLQSTLTNIDQVLLQRIVPERVFYLKFLGIAVLACSRNLEVVSLPEQARFYTVELDRHVIEVAQYVILIGRLHCLAVV